MVLSTFLFYDIYFSEKLKENKNCPAMGEFNLVSMNLLVIILEFFYPWWF